MELVQCVMEQFIVKSTIFWDVMSRDLVEVHQRFILPPSSGAKSEPSKKPAYLPPDALWVLAWLILCP
jgi:hypothetical protein